jgi:hypothetical protein
MVTQDERRVKVEMLLNEADISTKDISNKIILNVYSIPTYLSYLKISSTTKDRVNNESKKIPIKDTPT